MAIDPSTLYGGASTPSGTDFLTQYGNFVGDLVETAVLRLTSVAGTADDITASAEPFSVPATGLVTGMKFTLVPVANNTGAATLNIDARGAESIVSGDGSTLTADELVSSTRYLLEFDGTNFVILGASGGSGASATSVTIYDTTTVWTNNLLPDTPVMVELWGAGGGGGTVGGGGGAGYAMAIYRAGDLSSLETITIPSSASANTNGGNATFGSLLTAYGGGRGGNLTGEQGGGGGELQAGNVDAGGAIGGSITDALTIYGGGGGGEFNANGNRGVFGGGGGGGNTGVASSSGGLSAYGGNGGGKGSPGQRPGGGGGGNAGAGAAGGAGRCRITVFGG